jgi:hypothetical protein
MYGAETVVDMPRKYRRAAQCTEVRVKGDREWWWGRSNTDRATQASVHASQRSEVDILQCRSSRYRTMRYPVSVLFASVLSAANAQRPTIGDILSMRDCLDTACISAHVRPLGYCPRGGVDKDGYLWIPCAYVHAVNQPYAYRACIGFCRHGDGGSHYSISTQDTAYADTLTAELVRLGFQPPTPLDTTYTPWRYTAYRSAEHPDFFIRRDEVRWKNDGIPQLTWRFKVIKKHP